MNKRALVTGAEGFIGSHLVGFLLRQGWSVRAFVLYNSFQSIGWLRNLSPEEQDAIDIHWGDIRDFQRVSQAIDKVDVVFHLAALIAIPYSYQAAQSYLQVNAEGTLNVLEAAKKQGKTKVLCMSTSEVYGTAQYIPIDETHPLQPQSPYSASKIAAESMSRAFYHSFETDVCVLRPFNTYGPRQSTRAVIPSILLQLLRGKEEIKLGDPNPTRDFLYVEDHVAALERVALTSGTAGKVLNIATETEVSIGQLAETLIQLINPSARIVLDPKRLRPKGSEVMRLYGSAQRIQQFCGWKAAFSLEEGLDATLKWFGKTENQAFYGEDYAV